MKFYYVTTPTLTLELDKEEIYYLLFLLNNDNVTTDNNDIKTRSALTEACNVALGYGTETKV